MKLRIAGLLALLLCGTGCYTVDVYAPRGMDVTLLPASAPVESVHRWRTWFAAWGLVPMDETMPTEMIERDRRAEVRIVVVDTIPDALIGILYNVIFPIGMGVQSMEIQGRNYAPRK